MNFSTVIETMSTRKHIVDQMTVISKDKMP